MDRNLFRRVETCFPIEDKALRNRVIKESLMNYLSDNTNAWILQTDGSYKRCTPGSQKTRSSQIKLLETLA